MPDSGYETCANETLPTARYIQLDEHWLEMCTFFWKAPGDDHTIQNHMR